MGYETAPNASYFDPIDRRIYGRADEAASNNKHKVAASRVHTSQWTQHDTQEYTTRTQENIASHKPPTTLSAPPQRERCHYI